MSANTPYSPPPADDQPWDRAYPREWWVNRPKDKPTQTALNRAYRKLEEVLIEETEQRESALTRQCESAT